MILQILDDTTAEFADAIARYEDIESGLGVRFSFFRRRLFFHLLFLFPVAMRRESGRGEAAEPCLFKPTVRLTWRNCIAAKLASSTQQSGNASTLWRLMKR